ncbi:MAG TPA: ABC transporter substrate-binding protein [Hypericibacter adhaerens]|uniref:ABC transporter substrate-binding protein n=1 Tax=Hypericibacter adhaerens TaxID=2602016 RepID=UPI002C4967CE|nr:ABC transporter substrate-binding protein [Hypericibacter adhaerens]HWA46340.1 ABC transporter substrate-binding protein [Hypericibacter adhaerens]
MSFRAMAADMALARLSYGSGWDALPAIIGIERGFFAEQKIIVSGLAVASPTAVIDSLAVGTTDFALVPQRVMLVMVAAKLPIKVIAQGGWGTEMELVARPDSNIKAVADLKGKTVAVVQGSEALPVLVRLLNQAKLKPTDVKIANMSADALLKSLADKKADAVFETRHFTVPLVDKKEGNVVLDAAGVTKMIGVIGAIPLVARSDTVTKDADLTQRFVNAWVKSVAYIQKDPEDAARVLQIFFHRQGVVVAPPMAQAWVKMIKYDQYSWSAAAVTDAEYNGWALNADKILKVAPKLAGYVDNRFADTAVKTLQ